MLCWREKKKKLFPHVPHKGVSPSLLKIASPEIYILRPNGNKDWLYYKSYNVFFLLSHVIKSSNKARKTLIFIIKWISERLRKIEEYPLLLGLEMLIRIGKNNLNRKADKVTAHISFFEVFEAHKSFLRYLNLRSVSLCLLANTFLFIKQFTSSLSSAGFQHESWILYFHGYRAFKFSRTVMTSFKICTRTRYLGSLHLYILQVNNA